MNAVNRVATRAAQQGLQCLRHTSLHGSSLAKAASISKFLGEAMLGWLLHLGLNVSSARLGTVSKNKDISRLCAGCMISTPAEQRVPHESHFPSRGGKDSIVKTLPGSPGPTSCMH